MPNESRFDDLELREEPARGRDFEHARFSEVKCTQYTFGCTTACRNGAPLTGGCCE
ncbi:MAG TPA: hypothetical protein VE826_00180 [Dongiaceae bacterium]|nr:hypothetical protein [Dongiaceae bacterium]